MARINIEGMTVQDILNMDYKVFRDLDTASMKKVLSRLNSAANKRIARLSKSATTSPALESVRASGGKFSVSGKNLNELRAEYARAKNFMQLKSSTVRGWKNIRKDTIRVLQARGVDINAWDFDETIKIYERLKDVDPSIANRRFKYLVMSEISQLDESLSLDDKVEVMRQNLTKIYEEQAALTTQYSLSEFFEQ